MRVVSARWSVTILPHAPVAGEGWEAAQGAAITSQHLHRGQGPAPGHPARHQDHCDTDKARAQLVFKSKIAILIPYFSPSVPSCPWEAAWRHCNN